MPRGGPSIRRWVRAKHRVFGMDLLARQAELGVGASYDAGTEQSNCLILIHSKPQTFKPVLHSLGYLECLMVVGNR